MLHKCTLATRDIKKMTDLNQHQDLLQKQQIDGKNLLYQRPCLWVKFLT